MSSQSAQRVILAIDPGPVVSGFVVLDGNVVLVSGVEENSVVLSTVLPQWADAHTVCAIEMIASYGMPVGREVFETCVWIGRFTQAWCSPEAVRHIYRRDVKLHMCGSVKAKDSNVWQAILDRFGGKNVAVGRKASPGPLYGVKSHARAALAVALTARQA